MQRKNEYFSRTWDETDAWAVRTFGHRTPKNPSKRIMLRDAVHRTVGQAAFNALFRTTIPAACG